MGSAISPERMAVVSRAISRGDAPAALYVLRSELGSERMAIHVLKELAPALLGPHHSDLLTPREVQILRLIADGESNAEIATYLGVATETVKTHVRHILGKLRVPTRASAVAQGFRLGLLE